MSNSARSGQSRGEMGPSSLMGSPAPPKALLSDKYVVGEELGRGAFGQVTAQQQHLSLHPCFTSQEVGLLAPSPCPKASGAQQNSLGFTDQVLGTLMEIISLAMLRRARRTHARATVLSRPTPVQGMRDQTAVTDAHSLPRQVFKGTDTHTGALVAIKQLSLAGIPADNLQGIMGEIDLLKNLNHRNIVKYIGSHTCMHAPHHRSECKSRALP